PAVVGASSIREPPATCSPRLAARSATEPPGSAVTTTSTGASLLSAEGRTLSRHMVLSSPLVRLGLRVRDRRYGLGCARARLRGVETSAFCPAHSPVPARSPRHA